MSHWTLRWSLLLVVLVTVGAFRFGNMATNLAPPGSDYGNWLAFGKELAGLDVKAARAVYPPLTPVLSLWLATLVGPLLAGKILANLTSVLSGIPVFAVASSETPWGLALLGTSALVATGYRSEVVGFGGYPQLLAEAFAVGALSLYATGAATGRWAVTTLGAVVASLVVGSHHLTTIFLIGALAVCTLVLGVQGTSIRSLVRASLWFGLVTIILSIPYVTIYSTMVKELSGSPFNVQHWTIATAGETFAYVFRNSVGLWYALMGVVAVGLFHPGSQRRPVVRSVAIASIVASLTLFVTYGEVRFLQFLFPGMVLGFILTVGTLWDSVQKRSHTAPVLLVTATVLVVSAIAWAGVQFTRQAFPWYQVIDGRRLEALNWLRDNTSEDVLVASTGTRNGWALGWWIEGYASRRTLSGGDPKWMAYREEKDQTRIANAVFDLLRVEDPATAEFAAAAGIAYLVVDKEHLKVGEIASGLRKVFENESILVLRVDRSSSRSRASGQGTRGTRSNG